MSIESKSGLRFSVAVVMDEPMGQLTYKACFQVFCLFATFTGQSFHCFSAGSWNTTWQLGERAMASNICASLAPFTTSKYGRLWRKYNHFLFLGRGWRWSSEGWISPFAPDTNVQGLRWRTLKVSDDGHSRSQMTDTQGLWQTLKVCDDGHSRSVTDSQGLRLQLKWVCICFLQVCPWSV